MATSVTDATPLLMQGMSVVFESLGRGLLCLDDELRVVHTSQRFDELIGEEAAQVAVGRPAADLFGADLFGPQGELRRALEAGERREGWGATVRDGSGHAHVVSITVAPLLRDKLPDCDRRVSYVVVVRPAEEGADTGNPPTAFAGMVARSEPMLRVFRMIRQLQESDATVLLQGESGTGKELVARAIHQHSPRRGGPFVAINCAALPGELLESELFGHVKGAFTGAVRDRAGRFEIASGGTLFLDEVGDIPLPLQVKLLRVLQERTYERVGDNRTRVADARIVAATHVDLMRAIREGRFRDDLYYRLRVVPIEIPPLRERREDIEVLARHLLQRVGARQGRSLRLAPDALRVLLAADWPGNVRELENALEYATAVSRGQTIHSEDLPSGLVRAAAIAPVVPMLSLLPPAAPQGWEAERATLLEVLQRHRWRRASAARALGISRTTLWRRMRELRLES
ncbi:MAG: sigma-54 interaction domain-containing protein [Acidobacteriota bacterium]